MVLKNLFPGQQWRNRHRERTYGHGDRGGEGEMYGDSNMETYSTICKIDSQWEFSVWLRKLKQGLCINLEGWDGEGDGREVEEGGGLCVPMTDLGSLVAQTVKWLPTMWETRVRSLGGENPLEKEIATHSITFAWKIPWEEPGRLQSMGSQRIGHD